MSDWLESSLNGFLAKLGLPMQPWHSSPHLSLQFDGDITCEISVLDSQLMVSFLTPIVLSSQTQVLAYLSKMNPIHFQKGQFFRYHWYQNQAIVQLNLVHEEITEIALEQAFTALLNESQTIKTL